MNIGRLEHGFNCRPDLVATVNKKNPRSYLGRFWVDSLVHDPKVLQYLVETIGEDRVMLGSDYPFPCTCSFHLLLITRLLLTRYISG